MHVILLEQAKVKGENITRLSPNKIVKNKQNRPKKIAIQSNE